MVSDDTPIELHRADLLDRLQRRDGKPMTLREAFEGQRRSTMIGLFLALLDLVRQHRVSFRQGQDAEGTRGEIVIEARGDADHEPVSDDTDASL